MDLSGFLSDKSQFGSEDVVCFCFGHTRQDIEEDYRSNGQSMILAKIMSAKKAGGCQCAVKNPKGR